MANMCFIVTNEGIRVAKIGKPVEWLSLGTVPVVIRR